MLLDQTHDASLMSWVACANGHPHFPIQNLPLGVFSRGDAPRGGMAIGDRILDLKALAASGLLTGEAQAAAELASADSLNALLGAPADLRRALRVQVSALLSDEGQRAGVEPLLHPAADCQLHLPARIGDYTDFYVGIHHAMNVGALFRPDNPLLPNYKHVPIGYHGRASSVRASGTPVIRPNGQLKAPDAEAPVLAPSKRLDFELELGVWIGQGNELGQPIPLSQTGDHMAGLCLLNDWSARDVQAWEYQPLGPFLAKNFITTVSPWIVTAEALEPYRIAPQPRPEGDPDVLPYLKDEADQARGGLALELEVRLSTARMRAEGHEPVVISRSHARHMYWTIGQMIAHHTSGGCNLNPGDLLGTGTISTPDRSGLGSLLELTRGGAEPITLPTGETRSFLLDGDALSLSGQLKAEGRVSLGFGDCTGIIHPAPAA